MKLLVTALGICALLAAPVVVYGDCEWTGTNGSSWKDAGNWSDCSPFYPGEDSPGDEARIANSNNNPVLLSASLENSISSLTLNAGTAGDAVSFLHSGGENEITGALTVIAGSTSGYHAVAQFTDDTLSIGSVSLQGSSNTWARAKLDIDETGLTVSGNVTVKNYSDIEVAEDESTSITGDLEVGDGSTYAGNLYVNDGGTITAGKVVIKGYSSGSSVYVVGSKTKLQTN